MRYGKLEITSTPYFPRFKKKKRSEIAAGLTLIARAGTKTRPRVRWSI